MSIKMWPLALASIAVLALGCSNDSPSDVPVTPSTTQAEPSTETETITVPVPVPVPVPGSPAPDPKPNAPTVPVGCQDGGEDTSTWNTLPDNEGPNSPDSEGALFDITYAPGKCFDKVIFTLDTKPGFRVEYVSQVTQDGSGLPVEVIGGAKLQLVMFAPVANEHLFQGYNYQTDQEVYQTLRNVVYANTFEAVTTFGIGVNEKTPFAVEYRDLADGNTQIVVFVAH